MAVEEQTIGTDETYFLTTRVRQGQKLTISNRTVSKLAFTLRRLGTISGDISFYIRAVDDDEILAMKVLGDASIISTSATQYEVTFDSPVGINEEVRITVDWPAATFGASDYLKQTDEHSQVKSGEGYTSYTGSAWNDALNAIWDATYKYTYVAGIAVTYPDDAVARVSSIRHIYRPGFFMMQAILGDIGMDIDVAETTVRKALDTAKEITVPAPPDILRDKRIRDLERRRAVEAPDLYPDPRGVIPDVSPLRPPVEDIEPVPFTPMPGRVAPRAAFAPVIAGETFRASAPPPAPPRPTIQTRVTSAWRALTPWKEEAGETFGGEVGKAVQAVGKFFGGLFGR